MNHYILQDKKAILEENLAAWEHWFNNNPKTLKFDKIGNVNISTVFFGIDHDFSGKKPVLFETVISDGKEIKQIRYSTYQEAIEGHENQCDLSRKKK